MGRTFASAVAPGRGAAPIPTAHTVHLRFAGNRCNGNRPNATGRLFNTYRVPPQTHPPLISIICLAQSPRIDTNEHDCKFRGPHAARVLAMAAPPSRISLIQYPPPTTQILKLDRSQLLAVYPLDVSFYVANPPVRLVDPAGAVPH